MIIATGSRAGAVGRPNRAKSGRVRSSPKRGRGWSTDLQVRPLFFGSVLTNFTALAKRGYSNFQGGLNLED